MLHREVRLRLYYFLLRPSRLTHHDEGSPYAGVGVLIGCCAVEKVHGRFLHHLAVGEIGPALGDSEQLGHQRGRGVVANIPVRYDEGSAPGIEEGAGKAG